MSRTPMEMMIDEACGRVLVDDDVPQESFDEEAATLLAVVDAACDYVLAVHRKQNSKAALKTLMKAVDELKEMGWGD